VIPVPLAHAATILMDPLMAARGPQVLLAPGGKLVVRDQMVPRVLTEPYLVPRARVDSMVYPG
jgi:hypothetical protein